MIDTNIVFLSIIGQPEIHYFFKTIIPTIRWKVSYCVSAFFVPL